MKTGIVIIIMLIISWTVHAEESKQQEIVKTIKKVVEAEEKKEAKEKEKAQKRKIVWAERKKAETEKPSPKKEKEKEKSVPVKTIVKNEKVRFQAEGENVEELVEMIRKQVEVNVVMDRNAIKKGVEDGVVRTTITLKVDNMTFESALNWICRLAGLAWTIQDEAIFISTPDKVHTKKRKLRIYDIRDLSMPVQDFPGPEIELAPDGGGVQFN
jgi:hypothetical protein